jgi:acyl-CoA reductase-like NAD-dependent aldehyde dehydrogenase
MAKMLVGGELVDSVGKDTYEVRNPATGAVVDRVPKGNEKDVLQAIQAAETAFKEWSDVTAEDRGNALMNACELIKKNGSEIAQLLTQEQGKTLSKPAWKFTTSFMAWNFMPASLRKCAALTCRCRKKVPMAWSSASPSACAAASCHGISL